MKSRTMRTAKRGFTLIELLIVVAIIAILAAIAVPNFLEAQTRSKVARAKADMRTIKTGMESYFVDHNHYIPDWNGGIGDPNDEFRTWVFLTTPISYLTSVLYTPFSPKTGFDNNPNNNPSTADNVYEYWGTSFFEADPARRNAAKLATIHYIISALGPSLKRDNFFTSPQQIAALRNNDYRFFQPYDPTNGTVSAGDIIMTNRENFHGN